MEHLKTLNHDEMVALEGGVLPVIIISMKGAAKAGGAIALLAGAYDKSVDFVKDFMEGYNDYRNN